MIANRTFNLLMDDCALFKPSNHGAPQLNICELAGNLAYHAMMLEVHLTPKPGLVDCQSTGSHKDMSLDTFIASSEALRPFMKQFVNTGSRMSHLPAKAILPSLRKVGIQAEKAMFDVTAGVNTHKGMIFTLGLICGAVGWLYAKGLSFDSLRVRSVIKACCETLVLDDLANTNKRPVTAGEKIYHQHGLTGIRGEAANGYPTIYDHALPEYQKAIRAGDSEEQAMTNTLLVLMANNSDSNLVNRGGVPGLKFVKNYAYNLLEQNVSSVQHREALLWEFDAVLVEKNLSPGGSADLLAATWLLAQLDTCTTTL